MKIYLIRHGETTGDVEDRYGGDFEDHLSEKGIEQAKELAEKIKDKNIKIIFHSPRIRAVETAEIVGQKIGVPMEAVNDLRERNAYGVMTGMVKSEAKEKYPDEAKKFENDRIRHKVEGSEDYESFKSRVLPAFDKIFASNQYKTIAIITHGGPISTFVREELKLGEFEKLGDCSIMELEADNGKVRLINMEGSSLKS